jgi:hypothetical protein
VPAALYLGCQVMWADQPKPAVAWEYRTLIPPNGEPDKALNELGRQGWELVTATDIPRFGVRYVFKRARP